MSDSIVDTSFGVKALCTSVRNRLWSGSSLNTIVWVSSRIVGGRIQANLPTEVYFNTSVE